MQEIKLTPAAGGWVHADWGDGQVWVRFAKNERGGLIPQLTHITELHMLNPSPERLRRVPLKRIQAAVNMRGAWIDALLLGYLIDEPVPPDMFTAKPPADARVKLERRYRLKRPGGKRLDDAFYKNVAHAYQSAVAFGLNPRQAMVADTGAADATVAGWVLRHVAAVTCLRPSRGR